MFGNLAGLATCLMGKVKADLFNAQSVLFALDSDLFNGEGADVLDSAADGGSGPLSICVSTVTCLAIVAL